MPHECPLCLEALDSTDERFYPCACSYQICLWCYHRITETENRCPKCRRVYTGMNYEKSRLLPLVSSEASADGMASGDERSEDDQQAPAPFLSNKLLDSKRSCNYSLDGSSSSASSVVSHKGDSSGSSSGVSLSTTSRSARRPLTKWMAPQGGEEGNKKQASGLHRSDLRDVRVVRRELCYIVGLSPEAVADEEKLKDFEYLGKYGTVVNVIVNRNPNFKAPDKKKSCALYVTYSSPDEAKDAIMDLDNTIYQGRHLKASYGTTKYCSSFLRGIRCGNRSCYYLHSRGRNEDSFTVAQMNQVKETSRRLTCSALLASEFEAAEWKNNQNLFGVNRPDTIKYFTQDPLGMYRPCLSTIIEEVEAIRAASFSDDALSAEKKMSFVLLTPPPTAASAVHPALTVLPPPEGKELPPSWPPHPPQSTTYHDWNDWGFNFADEDFQNYNQVIPARMAPAQPSSLLDVYVTPADSQAVCTHPALLQLNRDISSAQKHRSHHLDMPPGYGYASHHIYTGRAQPTSTSPSDEIAYQYCLIQ